MITVYTLIFNYTGRWESDKNELSQAMIDQTIEDVLAQEGLKKGFFNSLFRYFSQKVKSLGF